MREVFGVLYVIAVLAVFGYFFVDTTTWTVVVTRASDVGYLIGALIVAMVGFLVITNPRRSRA